MNIGFIGLGIMGKPMAQLLINDGFDVYLLDLNKDAVNELEKLGGHACDSNKELAKISDIIITMLPAAKHVSQVLFGNDGVVKHGKPNTIIVDMSSISPEESVEISNSLNKHKMFLVDAPVSGGEPMAISGELSIMAGGEKHHYNSALPLFKSMGKDIVHMGPVGTGSATKLTNQILVSAHLAALSEALVFASKSGIDLNQLYEAIHGGLAGSAVMEKKMKTIINQDFEPGGRIETNFKDLNNIQSSANSIGVPLPVTNLVKEIFSSEIANGNKDKDHSYIINFFEKMANHKISK